MASPSPLSGNHRSALVYRHRTSLFLAVTMLLSIFSLPTVSGFTTCPRLPQLPPQDLLLLRALSSSSSNEPKERTMTAKLEAAAVRRFTVGYNKLCKNCPTRLQPRVDTLTEMIMGLTVEERNELLVAVAQRVDELEQQQQQQEETVGLRTPMEVYMFQIEASDSNNVLTEADLVEKSVNEGEARDHKQARKLEILDDEGQQEAKNDEEMNQKKLAKTAKKMEKAKDKFQGSDRKLAHAKLLLKVTNLLLANGQEAELPEDVLVGGNEKENQEIAERICELRSMTRPELKLQRLKYVGQNAKYEGAKAKSRAKRYEASLQLAHTWFSATK